MSDRNLEALLRALAAAHQAGLAGAGLWGAVRPATPGPWAPAVGKALTQGGALSRALSEVGAISAAESALLAAGEKAGRIPDTLGVLADMVGRRRTVRTRALMAVAYPALLVGLAGMLLPAPMVITQGVGAYLAVALWPAGLVGAGLTLVFGVVPRLPAEHGLRRGLVRLALSMPGLGGALRRQQLSTFCEVLGQLLSAGVSITVALPVALTVLPGAEDAAVAVTRTLAAGSGLSDALAAAPGTFPPALLAALSVGERTGTLDLTLAAWAAQERQAAQQRLLLVVVMVGLLLFLLVAAGIGFSVVQGAQRYIDSIDAATRVD